MRERDKRRSLLLVALVFALGIAVPKLVGTQPGAQAHLAVPARVTAAARYADAPHTLAPAERAALPGLAPAPASTSGSGDLAFAG